MIKRLLIFIFIVYALYDTSAQDDGISLKIDNQSFKRTIKEIRKQCQCKFIYAKGLVGENDLINIELEDASLEDVLQVIKQQVPVDYQLEKNVVVFRKGDRNDHIKERIIQINGQVLGDASEPLPGATIMIVDTNYGTTTDMDGNFHLELDEEPEELTVSYVGFTSRTIKPANRTFITITLKEDVDVLESVMVNALGFSVDPDESGATYNAISLGDVSRSGEATLLNSLGSKASNVVISRSNGDPGAGSTIRIRGANSITGDTSPLIIVDGIPISNETIYGGGNSQTGGSGRNSGVSQQSRINDINPQDIASIQVLKGASSGALWGSRSANGVIVITTKDGAAGKMKVFYKGAYSFDQINQRVDRQNVWGQGRRGIYNPSSPESWGDYIPDRSGIADEFHADGERFTAANGTVYFPVLEKNSRQTFVEDNWNQVFQTGGFSQHDLSISSGNNRSSYYLGIGRMDQEGIIKESDYERTSVRMNNEVLINDWLSVAGRANLILSSSNRIRQSSSTAGLMLGLLRTPPDFDNTDYIGTYRNEEGEEFPLRHRSYRRYLGHDLNPIYNNPLWTIREQQSESKVARNLMSMEWVAEPNEKLQVTLRSGIDNYSDRRNYFFPKGSATLRQNGNFAEDIIRRLEINVDAIVRSNWRIQENILLNTTLGWNLNDRKNTSNHFGIDGFLVNVRKLTTDLNTSAASSFTRNETSHIRSNRGYSVFQFEAFDQLYLNFSGAIEASSTVRGNFSYPAIDLAWQLTKLPVLNASQILTFAKLRGSWGKVGISAPPHGFRTLAEGGFQYETYDDPLDITLFGGGFRLDNNKGNENLRPEIKTEWEIGGDFRLLQDKIQVSATYYRNAIRGIIIPIQLTPSSGFSTRIANAASMNNKGFELDFSLVAFERSDWKVDAYGNWATNRNKVTELHGARSIDLHPGASISSRAVLGQPLGVLYGTGSQRDEEGNFILDENGFPTLTTSPVVLGDPNPDWRGGLGISVRWKKLSFNALVEHSQGGDYAPRTLWVLRRFGTTQETAGQTTLSQDLINYDGEVILAGTTVRGKVRDFGGGPVILDESWYRTGIGGGFGDNQAYNFAIRDATFTRLREVTFAYQLINSENRHGINSLKFSVTGRNLFLWDNIPGIDPEVNQPGVGNALGLEYFTNPSTRSIIFSVELNI